MTRPSADNERFLSRWSRLKRAQAANVEATGGVLSVPTSGQPPVAASEPAAATTAPATGEAAATTLPSIESLTLESDYAQFFQAKVPETLRRAAVKKLFADPHFNIMDGLDTYIDDYSKPDPIPPEMLARLAHARDIIDHPSNRKPEVAAQAPAEVTVENSKQTAIEQPDEPGVMERPEEQGAIEQPGDVVGGQVETSVLTADERATGLDEVRPPEPLAVIGKTAKLDVA